MIEHPADDRDETMTPSFLSDEQGQDLIEYGLLAALIAIVAITAIGTLGGTINTFWQGIIATNI